MTYNTITKINAIANTLVTYIFLEKKQLFRGNFKQNFLLDNKTKPIH